MKQSKRLLTAGWIALFLAWLPGCLTAQDILSLAGAWDFSTAADTATAPANYTDYVMLPGSMLTNGKGEQVTARTVWTGSTYDSSYYFNPYMEKYRRDGNVKFPFFLTPDRHYVGAAWYRRTVYVPREWKGERVTLFLERPHIETTAYVNGHEVGHHTSLSTPHCYNITDHIRPGEKNEIVLRVYNGIENVCVGQDSHSVTDQTQGNWNGIVGRIELQAGIHIWRKQVVPHLDKHVVDITINEVTYRVKYDPKAQLWDEFHPQLYTQVVRYNGWDVPVTFGLRQVSIKGRQLYINGRPLFLRGTVENCCFPETGYPPTDEEAWERIFRKMKDYGLNHMRFHSYCPPEAAFAAADRVGIYLQPEGPSWPNHGVRLRRGQAVDDYLMVETKRIVNTYGHHPSFIMMAVGNEPAGDWVSYCNDWVKEMRDYDPTKIYAGASVGGGWAWDSGSDFHVKGGARGLDPWNSKAPSSDDDYYSGIEYPRNYKDSVPNHTPIITHEKGQWCAFPDLSETSQYTGAYKARNYEIFADLLRDNGMASQAEKFLMASGKLQTLCYKYEIERNLRTKDYAGFQLLGLNDYSGQGTAVVGVLNVHWREKGYCTPADWIEFCSPIVPLARFPRFVYTTRDTLNVDVEVYNAFCTKVKDAEPAYTITDDSLHVYAQGTLTKDILPIGKNNPLGHVRYSLDSITAPVKLTLTVKMGHLIKNHWNFWVYPEETASAAQTNAAHHDEQYPSRPVCRDAIATPIITDDYQTALSALKKGKTVLLTAAGKVTLGSDVKQTYLPVFWNTSWFKMRPPHTTGAYIDNSHPLFRYGFPTDSWSNLNWWELLNHAQVMNLRELPLDYQPPIQPIDTWHVSRKLGMLIEANVLKGRLLMTTMDITNHLDTRVVARQMRKAILCYMQSADFAPTLTLEPQVIADFFTKTAPAVDMFTNESPDELKPAIVN